MPESVPSVVDGAELTLRAFVTGLEPGGRLPSVREMRRMCEVSQSVIDRVVSRLQAEGVVEVRPRSGIYRTRGHGPRVEITYGPPARRGLARASFHDELLHRVMGDLAAHGRLVRSHTRPGGGGLLAAEGKLPQVGRPTILTFALGEAELPAVRRLAARGTPMVHLLPDLQEPVGRSIVPDHDAMVRLQVEHLRRAGHRRIGFLHACAPGPHARVWEQRLHAFYRLAVEFQLELTPERVAYADKEDEAQVRAAVRGVAAPASGSGPGAGAGAGISALILCEDGLVRPVYAQLRAMGLPPGERVAVVGTNDRAWCPHVDPPLTSVRLSLTELSAAVLGELDAAESPPDPPEAPEASANPSSPEPSRAVARRVIQPRLIARASSAPLPGLAADRLPPEEDPL